MTSLEASMGAAGCPASGTRRRANAMKSLALLSCLALAGCATAYKPEGLTGGYSDFLTDPDQATIMFQGNGLTSAERVVEITALRCAEVTLQHGWSVLRILVRTYYPPFPG